ncbi:unnamed protein product [Alternaria alternata]
MSRNNKSPDEQAQMRTNGLSAYDWAVMTEYMNAPEPLETATRRLEGRGKQVSFVAIAEIMLVFVLLSNCYEERVDSYEAANCNAHDEAPEDHFGTNLSAAWVKANNYHGKLDDTAIYYTVTLIHPYYATYCEQACTDKPDWLRANNRKFRAL